ncbi:MAG: heparinase II/III family protein [Sphingorhabdus sp.]|nr:heparinase II/III family protein [Sphingorhabdus sp.]
MAEADRPDDKAGANALVVRPAGRLENLAARVSLMLYQLSWRTPLHKMRITGKLPMKLLAAPANPLPGDEARGTAIRIGKFLFQGMEQSIDAIDYDKPTLPPAFADYVHRFDWLRDLVATVNRGEGAPLAASITEKWLAANGDRPRMPAWRIDNSAWRFLNMASAAPYLLTSSDLIYRSKILNHFARTARHLDQSAGRATKPFDKVCGWAGVVAASLLLPEGKARRAMGEHSLEAALRDLVFPDGGVLSRAPQQLMELIALLSTLRECYIARQEAVPDFLTDTLGRNIPALLGLTHADGGLGAWQGCGHVASERIEALVQASGVRARPLRQALDWGYQRVSAGPAVLQVDAGPPPHAKQALVGCASTLAFEFSFGKQRIVINCGGAGLAGASIPAALARGLRTTAAHSTLCVDDSNSTALLAKGQLGAGVVDVELERRDIEKATRIEANHDGYARAYGFIHNRVLILRSDGLELRGEDTLLPHAKYKGRDEVPAHLRFHLGPDIELLLADDKRSVVMRLEDGSSWTFMTALGTVEVDDSIWVDENGRPNPTRQLVIGVSAPRGGMTIGWVLKFLG